MVNFPKVSITENFYFDFSAGRKLPGPPQRPPQKQQQTVAGRTLKVSDEITIIPQGKNTQAKKPIAVSFLFI